MKFDALDLQFDVILYVYRRDKVAQAHSYAKAMTTDRWRSYFASKPGSGNEPVARSATANALLSIVGWEEFYETNLSRRVNRTIATRTSSAMTVSYTVPSRTAA